MFKAIWKGVVEFVGTLTECDQYAGEAKVMDNKDVKIAPVSTAIYICVLKGVDVFTGTIDVCKEYAKSSGATIMTKRAYDERQANKISSGKVAKAGKKAKQLVISAVMDSTTLPALPLAIETLKNDVRYSHYDVTKRAMSGMTLSAGQVAWIITTAAQVTEKRSQAKKLLEPVS